MLKRLILALFLTLAALPVWAVTWTHVNGKAKFAMMTSGVYTLTLGWTPTSGNLLVFGCAIIGNGTSLTPSDNSSGPADSWSTVVVQTSWHSDIGQMWGTNITAGTAPTTVTCTSNGGSGTQYANVTVDEYSGGPNPFVQDGSGTANTGGANESATGSYTTGSNAGDLVYSALLCTPGLTSATVAGPFTMRSQDTGTYRANSSDDGVSGGVASGTPTTSTYTLSANEYWIVMIAGFGTGSHAYTATPSESNIASDSLSRQVAFGRGDTETNTASDAIARGAVFTRTDAESSTASDTLIRRAVMARSDSESNVASEAVARLASFGRGDSESNSASDLISRLMGFVRSNSESNATSDALVRAAVYLRQDAENNPATDSVARLASYSRAGAELLTTTDSLSRMFAAIRSETESLFTSDVVSRMFAGTRGSTEALLFSDSIFAIYVHHGIVFVQPRHGYIVPWLPKTGEVPGQNKSGTVPGQPKTGEAPVH